MPSKIQQEVPKEHPESPDDQVAAACTANRVNRRSAGVDLPLATQRLVGRSAMSAIGMKRTPGRGYISAAEEPATLTPIPAAHNSGTRSKLRALGRVRGGLGRVARSQWSDVCGSPTATNVSPVRS